MTTDRKQKLLPLDSDSETKEQQRQERIERLLKTIPKLDRASAPVFDYQQATRIAEESLKRAEATKEPPRDRIVLGGEFEPYTASENN
jgi:hypothetical protein